MLWEKEKILKIKKKIYDFATFGDSFVFCRYVKNDETWQEQLSKLNISNGLNFGVGNYGLDQTYLKYTNTKLPEKCQKYFYWICTRNII